MIKFVRGIHPDYLANVKKSRNIYTWNAWIRHLIFERKRALMMAHFDLLSGLGDVQDDPVVQAKKDFARQIATASGMEYQTIKGSDATNRHYRMLL